MEENSSSFKNEDDIALPEMIRISWSALSVKLFAVKRIRDTEVIWNDQ